MDLDILVYHSAISCEKDLDWENVTRTVDMLISGWISSTNSTHYVGFLTDSLSNYRITLAKTWPYKGHRKAGERPKYYQAIREYMVEQWGAQVMVGIEADDALAMAHTHFESLGLESVIVTEDKDLLQVPALHYNIHKNKQVFRISEEEGFKNLWLQVITGDRTDNIPGVSHACSQTTTGTWNLNLKEQEMPTEARKKLYKKYPIQELYGPATALKYLSEYSLSEWPSKVLELYIDKYEDTEKHEGYGDLRFQETFDLIYMLRTDKEAERYMETLPNYVPLEIPVDETLMDMFDIY